MRDLILNRTPKDFDIITSAELKEVFPSVIIIFFFGQIMDYSSYAEVQYFPFWAIVGFFVH